MMDIIFILIFRKRLFYHNKNIVNFLNSFEKQKYRKETDLYIGFFGYEILNNLLGLKIKKQKKINFHKGVFYKPETIIKIRKKISIKSNIKSTEI